jgi:hypothetical protein
MANADFGQQNTPRGGFSAESYRAQPDKAARSLTPTQKKLAGFEEKLPHFFQSGAVSVALAAVVIAGSIFGVGGAKLHSRYVKVQNAVTVGVEADTKYGKEFTIAQQLAARSSNAQSMITVAGELLGADSAYVSRAQEALDALNAARADTSVKAMYEADTALQAALDTMYAQAQSLSDTPMKMGTLQTAYTNYNSAGQRVRSLAYNELAQDYNDSTGTFPADMIGALWGCGKAELFA